MNSHTISATDRAQAARPCLTCLAVTLLMVVAVVASFAYLNIDYRALFVGESLRLMGRFIAEFFPPDLSAPFVAKVAWGAMQTLDVYAIGTMLAVLYGALRAQPTTGR